MTQDQILKKFTDFGYSLVEKLKPGDAEKIAAGMETFKESYLLSFFDNQKKLQLELAKYLDVLIKEADQETNMANLEKQLIEVGENVFKEFRYRYWKKGA